MSAFVPAAKVKPEPFQFVGSDKRMEKASENFIQSIFSDQVLSGQLQSMISMPPELMTSFLQGMFNKVGGMSIGTIV